MSTNFITLFVPAGLPQLWKDGHKGFAMKVIARTLQALLAVIVVILYAVELNHFNSTNIQIPASWIYAEVVASLSLITCALHYWYTLESAWWSILDFVICILWSAQAGYFGTIYLGNGDKDISGKIDKVTNRSIMKAGAGIGLACLILWLATCVLGLVRRCKVHRKKRTSERVDRTMATLEIHQRSGREMTTQEPRIVAMQEASPRPEVLPTYKEATTEEALAKQREALGKYDEEAAVSRE